MPTDLTRDRRARERLWTLAAIALTMTLTAAVELGLGRSPLGPDGRFGLWTSNIWSAAQSQRLADPYSFSHIVHGFLFYGFLWLVARRLPPAWRLAIAVLIEASWEVLENSPFIINRYRSATIALGYEGDSVLNSMSDIVMMSLGFLAAARIRPWASVVAIAAMELGCLFWIRDNLTLNIIMLVHPVEAIRQWQMAIAPVAGR
jgi:hypothetical protein